ncbi:hypothetical protein DQM68_12565 [Leptospira mayottensis]|uniref:Uncharacterized protein n=1 Tax=Leptospira mayottensis TaxID=1137606 RepID=A0ABM6YBI9_9LEPT|nr:hypothetical protein DQM68_12565 [Leptospira mayottensis]AXR65355.1 hypothetical protein DQM28_15175 [Leptospira mayottensis]AXR68957.1 hypothetical protein DPV73_14010 [Leptospira mayottensis]AZQ02172.1 hypothetical protein LEP1GSC190_09150 [Leptospira mayottensis 200901116]
MFLKQRRTFLKVVVFPYLWSLSLREIYTALQPLAKTIVLKKHRRKQLIGNQFLNDLSIKN